MLSEKNSFELAWGTQSWEDAINSFRHANGFKQNLYLVILMGQIFPHTVVEILIKFNTIPKPSE